MKLLKVTSILLFCFLSTPLIHAQSWLWAGNMSCNNISQCNGLKLDNAGNLIMYNVYQGTFTVKNRTITSKGDKDVLLIKLKPDGDTLWARSGGSTVADVPRDLVIAPNNDIYITGGFSGNCTFDNFTILNTTAGSEDIYLTRYNTNGAVIFAKAIAWGPGQTRSSGITLDADGNIYVVGFYTTSIYFSNDTLTATGTTVNNFLAKYDAGGNFIWATNYAGNNTQTRLNAITLSNDDALLISGLFYGNLTVGSTTYTSAGTGDIVLVKVDYNGNNLWARVAGGTLDDRGLNASSDEFGNIYLTGYVSGTSIWDSTATVKSAQNLVSKGGNDMFIAKYNKNGNLQWKRNNGTTNNDQGQGVYVHDNIVQFTGFFNGTVTFGNDVLTSSSNDAGFFIYDVDGNAIKGVSVQGTGDDQGFEAVYDNAGFTYLAGYFSSPSLTLGSLTITKGAGSKNPFIGKYKIPFSATFSDVQNLDCFGGNNGELTVQPYYGKSPYTYSWSHNGGLNSATATGLEAGNYTVTVTDANDSTTTANYTLAAPSVIDITLNATDLSCNLSADGQINTTATGGNVVGSYGYSWNGVTGYNPTSEDQSGLSAGWYIVTVTDDNLCTQKDSVELTQPLTITFPSATVVHAIPIGSSTGDIIPVVAGGTSPYNYAWSFDGTLLPSQTGSTLMNQVGGNYELTVTDDNACLGDTTFVIPDAGLLQINKFITNVNCFGENSGSAYVSIIDKNPVATYTYAWSNGSTDSTISAVIAGNYTLTITETGGLNRPDLVDNVLIEEPAVLSISSLVPNNVGCYGDSTGVIAVSVSGGTPAYNYLWTNGATTESLTNVQAGFYGLTVTDENLCSVSSSGTITQSDSIHLTFNVIQALNCFGDNIGVLQAQATGGAGGFSYVWDDPGNQTTAIATSLLSGNYTVVVQDQDLCSKSAAFELVEPDSIHITSLDTSNVSCFNYADGSISIVVAGGTAPYAYEWSSNNGNVASISNLGPGIYDLTITDNHLCTNSEFTFTVDKPATELVLDTLSTENNLCAGVSIGKIHLEASGGWDNYEYSINNVDWFTSPDFINLSSKSYTTRVRDVEGCNVSFALTLSSPSTIIINSSFVIDNQILVSASGGTPPLTYSLDEGAAQSNGQFTNVSGGDHVVKVSDQNSCGPVVTETLTVVTALNELKGNTFKVYPNPSEGHLNIQFDQISGNEIRLEIFSTTGARVYTHNFMSSEIIDNQIGVDLSALKKGIYLAKINEYALKDRLIIL